MKRKRQRSHLCKFQSLLGMTIIRHDIAVRRSRIRRGLEIDHKTTADVICGCGSPGCVVHRAFNTDGKVIGSFNALTGEVAQ